MLQVIQVLVAATVMIQFAIPQDSSNRVGPLSNAGCVIVDSSRPPQSISFERIEARSQNRQDNARRRVWLRLHNNTKCAIYIPTEGVRFSKLPSGSLTLDLQDGAEAVLNYEVQDSRRRKGTQLVYGGDEIIVSRLLAGRSVVFSVSAGQLKQRLNIVVPFRYEWEGTTSPLVGPVFHRIYFEADDLTIKDISK